MLSLIHISAIVRPDPDGGYEIVSGHRRHQASELAGKAVSYTHLDVYKRQFVDYAVSW